MSATIVCVWMIAACGRALLSSEVTWDACRDTIDNDFDGQVDCADPDCRGIPCVDVITDDGGSDADTVDASTTCDPTCTPGEVCRDQRCQIGLPTPLDIEVLSVDGPARFDSFPPACVDFAFEECGVFRPELDCSGCLPDPYVRVDIESPQPGGGVRVTTVGRTRPVHNREFASWNDDDRWELNPNPITLQPDDLVVLVEVDRDEPGDFAGDDNMFECVMMAKDLRFGPQRCVTTPSVAAQSSKSEFTISIDVRQPSP